MTPSSKICHGCAQGLCKGLDWISSIPAGQASKILMNTLSRREMPAGQWLLCHTVPVPCR